MSYSIPKADGHRFSSRISPILFPISFIIVLVTTVIICCVCEDEYEEVKKHDPTPLQKNDNYDPDDRNKGGFGWGFGIKPNGKVGYGWGTGLINFY